MPDNFKVSDELIGQISDTQMSQSPDFWSMSGDMFRSIYHFKMCTEIPKNRKS